MSILLKEPPPGFVDNYGTSGDDDPPYIDDDVGDGDDDWWKDPPDPMFLDLFLYYGSWFLITYNGFFATVGAAAWVLAP